MIRVARAWLPLCASLVCLLPHAAQAALQVCNRTSYILYTAEGWISPADNITQGWTRIIPGACATPVPGGLAAPAYFLYARSAQAHGGPARAWGGNIRLCAKDTNFSLKTPINAATCAGSDAFTIPFASIDTHRMQTWTATLTESEKIRTDEQARAAGIDRLLRDNGYKIESSRQRDNALDMFRSKMKLSRGAGVADIFDALETEALKASSPAGYSICNDTAGEVWVALGFRTGKRSLAAGWWKVPASACAHTLTEPLNQDIVYVHAEAHNRPNLVSGKVRFCVTNITFQISGDLGCTGRGLSEAGFAATRTKGRTGYTVHIGDNGLLPAPSQASMPK